MQGVSWETLGLTIAGWLVGLASALLLDWVRGTRRLRGIAKALLEEVRRIRVELGSWGGFSDVQIAGATSVGAGGARRGEAALPRRGRDRPRSVRLLFGHRLTGTSGLLIPIPRRGAADEAVANHHKAHP